jgi:hypothetical protein
MILYQLLRKFHWRGDETGGLPWLSGLFATVSWYHSVATLRDVTVALD